MLTILTMYSKKRHVAISFRQLRQLLCCSCL